MGETQPAEHLVAGEGVAAEVGNSVVGHVAPGELIEVLQGRGKGWFEVP